MEFLNNKIETFGQVFTKDENILKTMFSMVKNKGKILEPSFGEGDFLNFIEMIGFEADGVEIDNDLFLKVNRKYKNIKLYNKDFMDFNEKGYVTIIGNPPYVSFRNIQKCTKEKLKNSYLKSSNLYCYFIDKCIDLLCEKGELIFITPRDFLTQTKTGYLNEKIFKNGTFTHIIDLGDYSPFKKYNPNCIIWRFEKNNFSRQIKFKNYKEKNYSDKTINLSKNRIITIKNTETSISNGRTIGSLFDIKVGAVSGFDEIFSNEEFGNVDFVCSKTSKTGKTKRMIYGSYAEHCVYLQKYKDALLHRKIKKFNENNWWEWGRIVDFREKENRIYVNSKTRNKKPFFMNDCRRWDGSILALFPKLKISKEELEIVCEKLNSVDWKSYGALCGNRFIFNKKIIENAVIDIDNK